MKAEPIAIAASAAVSALGADVSTAVERMLRGESGIRLERQVAITGGRGGPVSTARIDAGDMAQVGTELGDDFPSRRDGPLALAVAVGRRALRRVEHDSVSAERIGLVLATTKADIDQLTGLLLDATPLVSEEVRPSSLLRKTAGILRIGGPGVVVSNACASGLVAMMQGARWLRAGVCDRVLVIGVDVLSRFTINGFRCLSAMSPTVCRPFDANRDGLTLGEAAAALVLERRASSPVLGWMLGAGTTSDAFHWTAPRKDARGAIAAIRQALNAAETKPESIDYVNAHGTGTIHNDAMESVAYESVFGGATPVTSLKPYFGHTLGAAGVLETAVCLELMRRSRIPANLGLSEPGVPGRILIPTQPIERRLSRVLTVKVGFGGLNAAVVLGGNDE